MSFSPLSRTPGRDPTKSNLEAFALAKAAGRGGGAREGRRGRRNGLGGPGSAAPGARGEARALVATEPLLLLLLPPLFPLLLLLLLPLFPLLPLPLLPRSPMMAVRWCCMTLPTGRTGETGATCTVSTLHSRWRALRTSALSETT